MEESALPVAATVPKNPHFLWGANIASEIAIANTNAKNTSPSLLSSSSSIQTFTKFAYDKARSKNPPDNGIQGRYQHHQRRHTHAPPSF